MNIKAKKIIQCSAYGISLLQEVDILGKLRKYNLIYSWASLIKTYIGFFFLATLFIFIKFIL
jgi:hypothetical protein